MWTFEYEVLGMDGSIIDTLKYEAVAPTLNDVYERADHIAKGKYTTVTGVMKKIIVDGNLFRSIPLDRNDPILSVRARNRGSTCD